MAAISRRAFSKKTATDAAAVGWLAMAGAETHANPLGMPIGSQTYPHRAILKDLPAFCKTMADMGVTRLELCSPIGYGADFASLANAKDVKKILSDHGMKSESAHFGLKELREKQPESI